MKFRSIIFFVALASAPIPAMAQSSAQPVVPGNLTVSGCPGGGTPCFNQFSPANPLAVSIQSGGGTDNVNITQVGGNTVLTGAGATGTGSQRTTVAQDPTTIAGSAPGTAGTPSANVISVQGVTSGTAISVTQSASSLIGVKGADGAAITGTSNTFPVSEAPTSAAGNAIVPVVSQGASTLLGKASAGNLYTAYYTATADTWLMVFNTSTAPTNGATTAGTASGNMQDCVKVPSGTSVSIGGLPMPERFSAGIYFAASSTACATLTLATTGMFHGMVQ